MIWYVYFNLNAVVSDGPTIRSYINAKGIEGFDAMNLPNSEQSVHDSARSSPESKFKEALQYIQAFVKHGQVRDLDIAIQLQREVNSLTPIDHSERGPRFNNLSGYLALRVGTASDFTTSKNYIMESIEMARVALETTPCGHPGRSVYLRSLSERLQLRYTRMETAQDLEEAVNLAEEAKGCAPSGSEKNACLSVLRHALSRRFKRLCERRDIDRAVSIGQSILSDDGDNIDFLVDSAMDLRTRFDEFRDWDDLNEALKILRNALKIALLGRTINEIDWRPWVLSNMSGVLKLRFDRLRELHDLDEAIKMSNEAFELFPQGHSDRAHRLNHLGKFFRSRYDLTRSSQDLIQSTNYFELASNFENTSFLVRVMAWRAAAENYIEERNWTSAAQSLSKALKTLPMLTPRSVTRSDQLEMLRIIPDIGSLAASVFLKMESSPFNALKALETGRGITSSLAIDSRKDILELMTLDSELSSRYQGLRDSLARQIPNAKDVQVSMEDAVSMRDSDARALEALEDQIRHMLGLELFLKPLEDQDILDLAQEGPLVSFNVNLVGGHAFVVSTSGLRAISLPGLTVNAMTRNVAMWTTNSNSHQRNLDQILEDSDSDSALNPGDGNDDDDDTALRYSLQWLWDEAVRPVLEALQLLRQTNHSPRQLPRIWWIGGGLMALMPLHAAGFHGKESVDNTMSHVVSSYCSTLRTLHHARRKEWKVPTSGDRFLAVLAPQVPGFKRLNIAQEMTAIKNHVGQRLLLSSTRFKSREDLLRMLSECTIAHFACHGILDTKDPARSALILEGGVKLTIADLATGNFEPTQLAYLSACSTAESNAGGSIDENIHLANAFQLAGFCHVVGTLWAAYDGAAGQVAAKFYDCLMNEGMDTHGAVASALHEAVLFYKGTCSTNANFKEWAPFIHVGP